MQRESHIRFSSLANAADRSCRLISAAAWALLLQHAPNSRTFPRETEVCALCEAANSSEKESTKAAQRELQAEARSAHRLHLNRPVAVVSNKSADVFLVSAEWAESWRSYLKGLSPQPPPIDVSSLLCAHGLLRYGAAHRSVALVVPGEWEFLSSKYAVNGKPIRVTMRNLSARRGESAALTADSDVTALERFSCDYSPALCQDCNGELCAVEACRTYDYASASIGVRKLTAKQYETYVSKAQVRSICTHRFAKYRIDTVLHCIRRSLTIGLKCDSCCWQAAVVRPSGSARLRGTKPAFSVVVAANEHVRLDCPPSETRSTQSSTRFVCLSSGLDRTAEGVRGHGYSANRSATVLQQRAA